MKYLQRPTGVCQVDLLPGSLAAPCSGGTGDIAQSRTLYTQLFFGLFSSLQEIFLDSLSCAWKPAGEAGETLIHDPRALQERKGQERLQAGSHRLQPWPRVQEIVDFS